VRSDEIPNQAARRYKPGPRNISCAILHAPSRHFNLARVTIGRHGSPWRQLRHPIPAVQMTSRSPGRLNANRIQARNPGITPPILCKSCMLTVDAITRSICLARGSAVFDEHTFCAGYPACLQPPTPSTLFELRVPVDNQIISILVFLPHGVLPQTQPLCAGTSCRYRIARRADPTLSTR
jgi:hypothetical protein